MILEQETRILGTNDDDTTSLLPKGWVWSRINELCYKIQDGSHYSPQVQHTSSLEGRYLYITAKNIRENGLDLTDVTYVEKDFHDSIYKRCNPEEGDLLLTKDGVKTGITAINNLKEEFSLLSSVALFKTKRILLSSFFLKFFIDSPIGQQSILGKMTGTAIKRIILDKLKQFSIPLPPLPEQHRIVSRIEELFTKLDAGVEALKKVKAQVKRYRQAVLKYAFDGKLTEEWREAHKDQLEPASVLMERIREEKKKSVTGKNKDDVPFDNSGLPELPEGWVWVKVKDVGFVQLGRQRAPCHHYGEYMRPYLRVANVFEDRIDVSDILEMNFTPRDFETYRLEYGDILLNEGQSLELIGRPAIYRNEVPNACFQNTLVRFKAKEWMSGDFAFNVFRTYFHNGIFQRIARWTTGIAHLGAERFSNVEFPLPSSLEQQKIVEEIEHLFSIADEVEKLVDHSLKQSERLRQSILKRAFEGKLVPQDPNDEPAEKLLERILEQKKMSEDASHTGSKKSRKKASTEIGKE